MNLAPNLGTAESGTTTSGPLVSSTNLCKQFHDRKVLDGVDFDVASGEVSVIIGKSGSGKSTLLRVIAGLEDPEDGEVTIDGVLVRSGGARTADWNQGAAKVGMVFQSYTLWPHMNVLHNLTLAPRKILGMSGSEAEARAEVALSEVGMAQHIRSRSTQLSGGERQRVAIARALMNHPRVLFADEPTGNLDADTGRQIMTVLEDLHQKSGQTIVMVTHDRALAREADRVLVLTDGHLEQAK